MDSTNMILAMIGVCAALLGVFMFAKQLKALVKVVVQGGLGMILVFIINGLAGTAGLGVGVNLFTALFTGILGVPGLVSLYAAAWLLK